MNMELGDSLAWAWPIILSVLALPLISFINGLAGWSTNKKKATVVGVAFAMKTGHYLTGIVLGIALGVVLSLVGTAIRARKNR